MKTFREVYETIPGNGWLTEDEAALLWYCASEVKGPILEVGCYRGRSTCLLAALGRPLYCVDPFEGFDSDDPTGNMTCEEWLTNLRIRGYAVEYGAKIIHSDGHTLGKAVLFRQRVEQWEPRPVGFAYLDGDHSYTGTRSQIKVAQRCGAKVIAVHDVNNSGEGLEIQRACLEMLGPWTDKVERLAVWDLR